ncbi:MAG: N-formylglutamate amidohydrolase [Acidimicrobiia bacterium]|nr:N-formylglutamate amidohydrolase [Acidimicrobiia bacterium]
MTHSEWTITTGDDPIVATAIHAGHQLRDEIAQLMQLPEADRLREEDPFTDYWVNIAKNTVVVHQSRFEVDLNRPREKAVFVTPENAWGLEIWKVRPPDDLIARSLEVYDAFYSDLTKLCDAVIEAHGHVVVLDLHSYNHRRGGPDAPVDDPELNPEINLGTESIEAESWEPVVASFATTMSNLPFFDANLDVRANVKFKGGNMTRWINARYGARGCSIAVEMKKIYMDEWSGALDEGITATIGRLLESAAKSVRTTLADQRPSAS